MLQGGSGPNSGKAATTAMANLAEAIQGLVHHMRTEQQMIRDWVDSQAEQHREVRRLLETMVQERVDR
jgi:siroheme synthase (precorrin-2 oxidase/ferrochelatase)